MGSKQVKINYPNGTFNSIDLQNRTLFLLFKHQIEIIRLQMHNIILES